MRRREFTIGVLLAATSRSTQAQQPTKRRLAIVHPAIPAAKITDDSFWQGFFAELGRRGYVEGENLIVDRYSAEGRHERYPGLSREIVASHPDVIVTVSIPMVIALTTATRTITVVANMLEDPVKMGLVASLARPGINLTGVHRDAGVEIWGKRLEILKEAIPSASKIAFVGLRGIWEGPAGQALRDSSDRLRISLIGMLLPEGTPQEIERLFAAVALQRPDAILVTGEGDQYAHRQLIIDLAEKHRLPALYATGNYVERGGLMGYVANDPEARTRLVDCVLQVFNGARLGDIPILQNAKFDLVINLKTANTLGLEIPPSLVLRAEKVID